MFGSLRQPGSAPASHAQVGAIEGLYLRADINPHLHFSVAEGDVRVRVRRRVVRVHRQRGQVRVVSVVTAAEATNRPYSAAALSFL